MRHWIQKYPVQFLGLAWLLGTPVMAGAALGLSWLLGWSLSGIFLVQSLLFMGLAMSRATEKLYVMQAESSEYQLRRIEEHSSASCWIAAAYGGLSLILVILSFNAP